MSTTDRPPDQEPSASVEARIAALRLGKLTDRRMLVLGHDAGLVEGLRRRGAGEVAVLPTQRVLEGAAPSGSEVGGADRFDLILLLGGQLGEVARPRMLLESLEDRLTPQGAIVLEVDIAPSRDRTVLWAAGAGRGTAPSWRMVTERYLERFAYRSFGRAPEQPEGRCDRHIVHAFPRLPQVVLVTGPSHDGKTTLVRQLGHHASVQVRVDQILGRVLPTAAGRATPLFELLAGFERAGNRSVSQIVEAIVDADLAEGFAQLLCEHIPLEEPLVLVEGYGLWGAIRAGIVRRLDGQAVLWVAERTSADGATRLGEPTAEESVERVKARHAQELQRLGAEFDELRAQLERAREERAQVTRQLAQLRRRRAVRVALGLAELGSRRTARGSPPAGR